MGIGPDIYDVLVELGTPVEIIKHDSSNPVTEYIDYEYSSQASSPFITQYVLFATFSYNTAMAPGDLIKFLDNGQYLLVTGKSTSRFEQEVVVYESLLYKCNITIDVQKRTKIRNSDYELVPSWTNVVTNEPVLLTGMVEDHRAQKEESYDIMVSSMNLHISGDVEIGKGYRIVTDSGEKYEVNAFELRRFDNMSICRVSEDIRE